MTCVLVTGVASAASEKDVAPPANAPASAEWNARDGRLLLRYHDTVILDATIGAEDADGREVAGVAVKLEPAETLGDKVEQRLKFVPAKPQEGVELVLRGTATGSEEAFPAETLSEAHQRFPYVRNSVGLSRNLRNNAVFDRRWDWVLPEEISFAVYRGERGGLLRTYAISDGSESSRQTQESPPVWDGMAATEGRLYMAAVDASIVCFGN